jgi:hypothetical protein
MSIFIMDAIAIGFSLGGPIGKKLMNLFKSLKRFHVQGFRPSS